MKRIIIILSVIGFAFFTGQALANISFYDKTPLNPQRQQKLYVTPTPTPIPTQPTFTALNRDRASNGLAPLAWNDKLAKSAMNKACDMRDRHYFSHVDPDGEWPWVFIKNAGYMYRWAGENIAQNFTSDEAAEVAFIHSPGHRANILNTNYKDVGTAQCGIYTVQHFGAL